MDAVVALFLPILYLSILASFFFLLILFYSIFQAYANKTTNHCPHPNPVLGNLIPFLRNYHRFLDWASDLFAASPTGTIEVRGPLGLKQGVATARPLVVDHLLRSNFSNYIKGERTVSALSDLLGHGIFIADGHLWWLQRKMASHEFTTRSMKSFIEDVVRFQLRSRLLPLLFAAAVDSEVVDLQDVLRRFAFDNICAIAFGTDPSSLCRNLHGENLSFFRAFDEAVEISSWRLFEPVPWLWKFKKILNIGSERKLRSALKMIDDYAMKIISSKEDQELKKQDLLSRFMAAMAEEDNELSSMVNRDAKAKKRFLRDIVISFILAGKDTTSSGLTWFFWLLIVNPKCEERIYKEISHVKSEEEEWLDYDQLKEMHYLHAAITESLRLYPPLPIDSRVAAANDVLPDGSRVKAGWFADYSAYGMARAEEVWGDDCREYRPERWLNKNGEFVGVEAARFPVFHAGPRTCLGKEMAYVQMKAVAAAVIRRFKLESLAGNIGAGDGRDVVPPPYEMALTLRMKGGFPVRLRRRVD